jgi:hypothetical protein
MNRTIRGELGMTAIAISMCGVFPGVLAAGQTAPVNPSQQAGQVLRQIDDPHTGQRWLLMRDPARPGGPGRLLSVAGVSNAFRMAAAPVVPREALSPSHSSGVVIHRGDRLTVEQSTPKLDARFEAIALGDASVGSGFQARLVLRGKLVRVVALGPRRAAMAPSTAVQP